MNAHAPSLTTPHRAWLRIEDFLLIDRSGAFADYAKTELIDGEILCMNSQFQRHSYIKSQLAFRLSNVLATQMPTMVVLVEVAVAMPPHDMPEPDIVVIHGPIGTGPVEHPVVALIVEVADTTLAIDLGRKAMLYARQGVPEYWVFDVDGRRIVRHWQPVDSAYARRDEIFFGNPITAATFDLTVDTDGLC